MVGGEEGASGRARTSALWTRPIPAVQAERTEVTRCVEASVWRGGSSAAGRHESPGQMNAPRLDTSLVQVAWSSARSQSGISCARQVAWTDSWGAWCELDEARGEVGKRGSDGGQESSMGSRWFGGRSRVCRAGCGRDQDASGQVRRWTADSAAGRARRGARVVALTRPPCSVLEVDL